MARKIGTPLICPAGPFPAIVEDQSMPANQPLDALAEWQVLEALRWDRTKLAIHVEFDARCLADLAENFGACCLFPDGHPETAVLKVYGNWVREIVFHHACYRRVAACARSQQSDRSNDRSSEPATDGRAQDLSHVAVDVALHLVPPMRPDHDERRGRAGTAVTSSGWGHGRRATTPPPAGLPGPLAREVPFTAELVMANCSTASAAASPSRPPGARLTLSKSSHNW